MEKIMVNLYHPCREIDVWVTDEVDIALGQGYVHLEDIRALRAERDAAIAERNAMLGNALDASDKERK